MSKPTKKELQGILAAHQEYYGGDELTLNHLNHVGTTLRVEHSINPAREGVTFTFPAGERSEWRTRDRTMSKAKQVRRRFPDKPVERVGGRRVRRGCRARWGKVGQVMVQ